MDQILRLIEEEVEKRVNKVLEKISQTYDISMRQLLRDLASMPEQAPQTRCLGLTVKKTRCSRQGTHDGYCKVHRDQKPARAPPPPSTPASIVTVHPVVQHTHTLPPLFMRGCPACERTSVSPLCI